ncbi:hypothetical protein LJC42_07490, partial [Eubacteriales bacterium OttesenSCG-928-K08]|nr:hypothetical protein [Eubacteriales bacterium OttesenSCG-928-K08]
GLGNLQDFSPAEKTRGLKRRHWRLFPALRAVDPLPRYAQQPPMAFATLGHIQSRLNSPSQGLTMQTIIKAVSAPAEPTIDYFI